MLLELLQQDGLNPKRKGPDEFCSPCRACGGNDRLICKTDTGRYWCRQCGIKGDAIQYLRTFRGMTFREAAEYTGQPITGRPRVHNMPTTKHTPSRAALTPPPEQWGAKVEKLITEANSGLLKDSVKLGWLLKERGITRQTAERFRLGWNYRNLYHERSAWGLPEKIDENDKAKKLFIPSGLLIPGPDRLRIRRDEPGDYGKYYVLPGSLNNPMVINSGASIYCGAVIVESELDAILLCQEMISNLLIVATGSTSNGPQEQLLENLRPRPFVLVALDSDAAGGKAAWAKWMAVLRNAFRSPVPASWGKDHGEAYKNGHDLNLWFSAAAKIFMDMCNEDAVDGQQQFPGTDTD